MGSPASIHHPCAAETAESAVTASEFAALVSGCGLFPLSSRAQISLSGKDRMRWLNGMITNKVRDLPLGEGVYAFVLNAQGHILGDLYAYNRGESLLVDSDESQSAKLLEIFRRHIIMDAVRIANLEGQWTAIGIAGPKVGDVLRTAQFTFQELRPLQLVDGAWQKLPLSLARSDNPAVESYQIWIAPEQAGLLREALTSAGATAVGPAALELLRIACGIPRYGQDIRERDLPQETEQLRALNFEKGCYIGQEIVERIRSRGKVHRKFTGFEVMGSLPVPGERIHCEGKEVGEVTSSAALPVAGGNQPVALGYIRREAAATEQPLQAGEARLRVVELPFMAAIPQR
ncbi:MAG TPA: glycine cleavage T C-terminal barrel domain-containing protein [Terriglobales bacterium]|nr:glycine cleavage T C-terminal barrel domain-containing protein [Terriglobales bacterium]